MKILRSFLILFFIILLSSCFLKGFSQEDQENNTEVKYSEFIFELNQYIVKGITSLSSPEKFYMPQSLKALLSRRFIDLSKEGKAFVYYTGELYFPEKLGVIDSLGFYDADFEGADWIEACLARVEEERIAAQLAFMEEAFEGSEESSAVDMQEVDNSTEENASVEPESQELASEGAAIEEPAIEEPVISDAPSTDYVGKDGKLLFSEFEKEKLVSQEKDGKKILIYSSGTSVTRKFYNSSLILEKEELWNIKNADSADLLKRTDYYYQADSAILKSKEVTQGNKQELYTYNDLALISKIEYYLLFTEEENEKVKNTEKVLTKLLSRTYNDNKELISESSTDYVYKDEAYETLDYAYQQRYDYFYNEGDIPADFKYYEDGILKMYNKYSLEKGSYTSQIYFDEAYSVKTYYENNLRVRDVYYIDGLVRREKLYENN
ncbi:MAG: hypothetical protein K5681_05675 [Treponema sp.]|nr:hypothetical protein [Treponema sp.]